MTDLLVAARLISLFSLFLIYDLNSKIAARYWTIIKALLSDTRYQCMECSLHED